MADAMRPDELRVLAARALKAGWPLNTAKIAWWALDLDRRLAETRAAKLAAEAEADQLRAALNGRVAA